MGRVIVTVDDEHVGAIADVAQLLGDHGMTVEQVLEQTGQVIGSIPDDRASGLLGVEGVMGVREETEFQLPPRDADVQ